MDIITLIKTIRHNHELSGVEVAQRLQLSYGTVYAWESGRVDKPQARIRRKLREAFPVEYAVYKKTQVL